MEGIITAWGRILRGYAPSMSIEITRECPLRCPGCYAYGTEHLHDGRTARTFDLAFELVQQADLGRLVSATYPLSRGGDAIASLAARQVIGKVVVEI